MYIRKVLLGFIIFFVISNVSCSYDDLVKTDDYETKILIEFNIEEDVKRFEDRLSAINATVLSKTSDDNCIEYRLHTNYSMSSEEWGWLGDNFSCCIVDDCNEPLFAEEDIFDVNYDGICLNLCIHEDVYTALGEYDIFYSSISIDGVKFDVLPIEDDTQNNGCVRYIEKSDGTKEPLIKFAIVHASESLSGDISVTVVEESKK